MNPQESFFDRYAHRWACIHAVINLLGVGMALAWNAWPCWLALSALSFLFFILKIHRHSPALPAGWGYANWVTLGRLGIILVAGFNHQILTDRWLFICFLAAILLDGVDGYLARKFEHETKMGGALDMEVDAFMVLFLAWLHFDRQIVGWWILIPGSLRYLHEGIRLLMPVSNEFPPKLLRATVAVSFFVALILPFVTEVRIFLPALVVTGASVCLSFVLSWVHRSA